MRSDPWRTPRAAWRARSRTQCRIAASAFGCGWVTMTARVLIVEDHVLVAVSLQLALSARGWEVDTIDGPTAAAVIDHARRFQPQSVLLDIDLGHGVGSGIDLIKPLRAIGADVVMLTAQTRRAVLAACLEQGAAGWIGKDAFLDEVVARLNDVREGTPLIGCAAREAMIDELRTERAGLRRALSPFERLTARERDVLARTRRRPVRRGDRRGAVRRPDDRALTDPRRPPEARRAVAARRRGVRQPSWLEPQRGRSSLSPDPAPAAARRSLGRRGSGPHFVRYEEGDARRRGLRVQVCRCTKRTTLPSLRPGHRTGHRSQDSGTATRQTQPRLVPAATSTVDTSGGLTMSTVVSDLVIGRPQVRSALSTLAALHQQTEPVAHTVLPTGFDLLDDVLAGGIRQGEVLLLGGKPGVGKTIASLQWARSMAQRGIVAVYVCFEHDDVTLVTRLLSCELGEIVAAEAPGGSGVRARRAAGPHPRRRRRLHHAAAGARFRSAAAARPTAASPPTPTGSSSSPGREPTPTSTPSAT